MIFPLNPRLPRVLSRLGGSLPSVEPARPTDVCAIATVEREQRRIEASGLFQTAWMLERLQVFGPRE